MSGCHGGVWRRDHRLFGITSFLNRLLHANYCPSRYCSRSPQMTFLSAWQNMRQSEPFWCKTPLFPKNNDGERRDYKDLHWSWMRLKVLRSIFLTGLQFNFSRELILYAVTDSGGGVLNSLKEWKVSSQRKWIPSIDPLVPTFFLMTWDWPSVDKTLNLSPSIKIAAWSSIPIPISDGNFLCLLPSIWSKSSLRRTPLDWTVSWWGQQIPGRRPSPYR